MRFLLFPILALLACAGSSGDTQDPSQPATFPPEMKKGENVDEDGRATDPKIAACVDQKLAMDAKVGGGAVGLGNALVGGSDATADDLVKTPEADFQYCWCKANGFRGQRRDTSCLP